MYGLSSVFVKNVSTLCMVYPQCLLKDVVSDPMYGLSSVFVKRSLRPMYGSSPVFVKR